MTVYHNEFMSVPLEHASVRTYTSIKAPISIETRPLDNLLLNHTQPDKEGSGKSSFPRPPPPTNFQCNLAGRLSFPSVTSAATSKAWDPVKVATWAATPLLSPVSLLAPVSLNKNTSHQPATQSMHPTAPMPQPVTTSYASLTSDKLPSNQILVPASKSSLHSAGALKSLQILSKFWGDEV